MDEPYIFDDTDREVVGLAMSLLAKIWQSKLVPEAQKPVLVTMVSMLDQMSEVVNDSLNASITLTGPRRMFGDHEIYHHWTVEASEGEVRVDAGGYFYRPATGGDAFTSFMWVAIPGSITDCRDFSEHLRIVDDAQPFGTEVLGLDLSQPGFSVRIEVDGEVVVDDDEEKFNDEDESYDDEEDDEFESDEDIAEDDVVADETDWHFPVASQQNGSTVQLAVCLWGFMDSGLELVYAVAGRVYALNGNDEEILRTLNILSRHDFLTVRRVKVPSGFRVVGPDGTDKKGYASPRALNDASALLFNELLNELEKELPPIPDFGDRRAIKQSLGSDPLTCRTLIYEDERGACRAIVDQGDIAWLRSRSSAF